MRITESQLRRIIREALLTEAMITPTDAERRGITFRVGVFSHVIEITAFRGNDDDAAVVGQLHAEPPRRPCLRAWEITKSRAALDGLGPLMYDLMIDLVHPHPLTSDRTSVSAAAKRVWDHYMNKRSDIESLQLDNPEDELTPGLAADNCGQNSTEMWTSEDQPWHSLSISRAYRRAGGGTPIVDALEDLGIIEIVS